MTVAPEFYPLSLLDVGWPMAGSGSLIAAGAVLVWIGSVEFRALRSCGVSTREILGVPGWVRVPARR